MITEPIGVYLHIPYCVKRCNYCDFCSSSCGACGVPENYVNRLCKEILSYKGEEKILASTVFFGGGTPSLLTPIQLEKIISALDLVFDFLPDAEFTLEANPGTLDENKLAKFKSLGVNRLSLGMQSMHENELSALGRIHTHVDLLSAISMARKAGFDNVSCDLMYGIPHQSLDSFYKTLKEVISLSPEHVSVYGLMLEEGTPFFEMQKSLPLPSEDEECEMFYLADKLLIQAGYTHYEISNYAKEGRESRHNLKYWQAEEYIGFGAAASSYYKGKRFTNTSSIDEYLNKAGVCYTISETLSETDLAYEYAMLHLRLKRGISLNEYRARFSKDFTLGKEKTIDRLLSLGLIVFDKERLALTTRGYYLSNTVLTELL